MSVKAIKKLLKLNDLIPPLQKLVSEKNLTASAAYSLAFLTEEEQEHTLTTFGEAGVCGLSVLKAKEIRSELEAERRKTKEKEEELVKLTADRARLQKKLLEAQENADEAASLRVKKALLTSNQRITELEQKLANQKPEVVIKEIPDKKTIEELTLTKVALEEKERSLTAKEERLRKLEERHKKVNAQLKEMEKNRDELRKKMDVFPLGDIFPENHPLFGKTPRMHALIGSASRMVDKYLVPIESGFNLEFLDHAEKFNSESRMELALALGKLGEQVAASGEQLKALSKNFGSNVINITTGDSDIIDV